MRSIGILPTGLPPGLPQPASITVDGSRQRRVCRTRRSSFPPPPLPGLGGTRTQCAASLGIAGAVAEAFDGGPRPQKGPDAGLRHIEAPDALVDGRIFVGDPRLGPRQRLR